MESIKVNSGKENNIIGIFYEKPDGTIVKSIGWHGKTGTFDIMEEDNSYVISDNEFQTYKPRPDLEDFPNAKNPILPYDFDLCYDIKYKSQLREKIKQLEEELKDLRELMNVYNIKL